MPYFLRHYETFVERLTFFDGDSTDHTRQIIASCPKAFCSEWPGSKALVDDEFTEFANSQWKEARGHADWVIWVDADEFLYHPEITKVLAEYLEQGVEIPLVQGYTMLSDSFPTTSGQIYDEIKTGVPDNVWAKRAIFRGDIRWNVGRHSIDDTQCNGKASPTAELKLLHYRGLGLDWVRERHNRNWQRVPEHCRIRSYGVNTSPGYPGHHGLDWFSKILSEPRQNVI